MKKITSILLIGTLTAGLLSGCGSNQMELKDAGVDDKYRNYYEIFPYTFCDSDGDGIGDVNGIISKLDYIADMGINGLWLTPVHESPTYHKYDVVDYYSIDDEFGTIEDYEKLLEECDKRKIKVIMDLVVNHSSSQNEWFKEAVGYIKTLDEGEMPDSAVCKYVDYYNFKNKFESGYTQIEGTEWYYESQFWSEMPDLNLDSEEVRNEIAEITKYWLDKGVDGFRLDATTSYYTAFDDKNIEFLSWLNTTVKEQNPNAYIVGECWKESGVYSKYYSSGIDSFFNFEFADKGGTIAKVLQGGNAVDLGNKIVKLESMMAENNPEYIAAAFTSNHDTGRSAGYYPGDYSQERTKMAQGIAMMMGGCYFIYYGDELGMKGSGDDENKRAPMQWSEDPNAQGMCKGVATKKIEMKYAPAEGQIEDEASIYNYVKMGLKIRNAYPEIARGVTYVDADLSNEDILVMTREYNGDKVTIVMNTKEVTNKVNIGKGLKVAGKLLTGEEDATYEKGEVTMPPYSIMILK